jgi:hypothetical protein
MPGFVELQLCEVKGKRLISDSCRATDKFSPIRVQELKFAVANICCSLVMGGIEWHDKSALHVIDLLQILKKMWPNARNILKSRTC